MCIRDSTITVPFKLYDDGQYDINFKMWADGRLPLSESGWASPVSISFDGGTAVSYTHLCVIFYILQFIFSV